MSNHSTTSTKGVMFIPEIAVALSNQFVIGDLILPFRTKFDSHALSKPIANYLQLRESILKIRFYV